MRTWTRKQIVDAFLDWEAIFGSPPTRREWDIGWDGRYPSSSTVRWHFGTWQAAKDAAWPPTRKRTPARLWPRGRIIEEFQRWAREHHGLAVTGNDLSPHNGLPSAGRVRREFGSVAAANRAAGLAPLPSAVTKRAVEKYLPLRERRERT